MSPRFEHLRPQGLPAREGKQLAHQARRPVGVVLDLHDVLEGRVGRAVVGEEKVRVADDRLQHVVEVVRDAAGELPDGLHLLRLRELLLELALLGGVERVEERALAVAVGVADRAQPDAHRAAAFPGEAEIDRRDVAAPVAKPRRWRRRGWRGRPRRRAPHRAALRAGAAARQDAEQAHERGVVAHDVAGAADRGDGDRRVVEEAREADLGGALRFVDVLARGTVEDEAARCARAAVRVESEPMVDAHRQGLPAAPPEIEIEGFGAHAARRPRHGRHHGDDVVRHEVAQGEPARSDLGEVVVEPGGERGVHVDDRPVGRDGEEPGRRVIEIIDRVLQLLEDAFLLLPVLGHVGDAPQGGEAAGGARHAAARVTRYQAKSRVPSSAGAMRISSPAGRPSRAAWARR